MANCVKKFIYDMIDPKGKVSAPVVCGILLLIVSCFLFGFHESPMDTIPLLTAGVVLVGGSGTAEAIGAQINKRSSK